MSYTTVCIGGDADGRIYSNDGPRLYVPIRKPISLSPVANIADDTYEIAEYRAEMISFGDGLKPECLLVLDGMTLRAAVKRLIRAYSGDLIPTHSDRTRRS